MIHYFYHLDYPKQPEIKYGLLEGSEDRKSNLVIHARLYAIGEKYGIPGLKALTLSKFKKETTSFWNTSDFICAAEEVYTSTVEQDRGMRDAVVSTIALHPTLLDQEQVQDIVKNLELSFDLLMKLWKGKNPAIFTAGTGLGR